MLWKSSKPARRWHHPACTGRTGNRLSIIANLFRFPHYLSGMPEMISGHNISILVLIIIMLGATSLNSGCLEADPGTGRLTGNVSIGPLCPVEPCSVPHDQIAAAYAARPITISTPAGQVVATVTADPETGYAVFLKPGMYMVDIPHQGIGGSPELPATVTIRSGETLRLDISIDTGIR